jgi:cytochrome o ubiquinol oxidase subunit 2
MCVEPGTLCESQMAAAHAAGGHERAGTDKVAPVADNGAPEGAMSSPTMACAASPCPADAPMAMGMVMNPDTTPKSAAPLKGAGLTPPHAVSSNSSARPDRAVLASNS